MGRESIVMISYDNYYGSIHFRDFSDEEIHTVLDALTVGEK